VTTRAKLELCPRPPPPDTLPDTHVDAAEGQVLEHLDTFVLCHLQDIPARLRLFDRLARHLIRRSETTAEIERAGKVTR